MRPGVRLPSEIEDRNGNIISFSSDLNCTAAVTMTDTADRAAVVTSGFGATGDTVKISGLSKPYTLTWGTVQSSSTATGYTLGYTVESGASLAGCRLVPRGSKETVVTAIKLPNDQQYQVLYNDPFGLVSKIIFPNGGYIQYDWGVNSASEAGTFEGAIQPPMNPPEDAGQCSVVYDTPAIQHRYVSYDGVTIAEQQDFTYSTQWTGAGSTQWAHKYTTVTTHDLIAGTQSTTSYTYTPVPAPDQPAMVLPDYSFAGQIPMEQTVIQSDSSGTPLKTVTETWSDPYLMTSQKTTLPTGASSNISSNIVYKYSPSTSQLTEMDEYNFGQSSIGRKTITNYQSFSTFPPYLSSSPIDGLPCQSIVYGSTGTAVAETDYLYDGGTSVCGTAGTPSVTSVSGLPTLPMSTHDETHYGQASAIARGNATSIIKKCFPNCTNATSTYTYDETGQIMSSTDPCGNTNCTDVTGANHTTTYCYTDSCAVVSQSGGTNAYVTKITRPTVNGVTASTYYSHNLADGKLISSTDENLKATSYHYNTQPSQCSQPNTFDRLSEIDYPDGGKTEYCYNDSIPSVTTSELLIGSTWKTSVSTMDGIGHVIHSRQTSDPAGTDTVDTTYDGRVASA